MDKFTEEVILPKLNLINMALLSREKLLTLDTLSIEKVVLDEANDDYVFVKQMTAHEKNVWEMSQLQKSGSGNKTQFDISLEDYKAKLAVVTVCDENGNLLFNQDDYKKLSRMISAAKLEKIVDAAQKLNAITEEDKEEMTKNS